MAAPASPSGFLVQTGNGTNLVSWDASVGATSYDVQVSTDNITFSPLATVTALKYLDDNVTVGNEYWYKVRATNNDGSSSYTTAQSVVPVPSGEMSLGQIRLMAQQRADRVNSNFITKQEWNSMINQAMFELYDLLITNYEDYFVAAPLSFTVTPNQNMYDLPNGTNYAGAPAFYKLMGVDLAVNTAANAFVTVPKFNFFDRNRFIYPNTASTIYGVFNLQYRLVGNKLEFIPTPSSGQVIRLWYIPRMQQLLQDTDVTSSGISGWIEYVVVRAAYLALAKEESDTSQLVMQLSALQKRIEDSAMNRDVGMPERITDVRQTGDWGSRSGGFSGGGPIGGY